jgi:hypothetical protein
MLMDHLDPAAARPDDPIADQGSGRLRAARLRRGHRREPRCGIRIDRLAIDAARHHGFDMPSVSGNGGSDR